MTDHVGAFGTRLRTCRQSAGLSQEELAARSGLSVRAIRDLERGRTRWPYQDSLHRLADALELRDGGRGDFIAAAGRRLEHIAPVAAGRPPTAEPRRAGGARIVPRYLPTTVPAFVGRDDQLAALSQVLHQPGGTAIITAIGGTAGVGKTALAVQWAHQVSGEFPDGQLFVNLRGFDPSGTPVTPGDAVRMFLDALEIPADRIPQTVEAQLGLYRSLLVGKRLLVVLDNARDAAQVRPLLPGCPTCRVVVTSRNQLTGLAAIEAAHTLNLDVLTDTEAHQLLAQRVGAARLAADPGAAARIIAYCAHLPLALCIIAARAAMRPDLTLVQVADELAAYPNLDAFADGGDPAADVRAAFSWSYRQLDPSVARVFRLLGLHPGPDLERYAVAALAGASMEQADHLLDMLAHACLIQLSGPGRYSLHDLLRGYARELADEDGSRERQAALTRLFDYYLAAATAAVHTTFPAERSRLPQVPAPGTPTPVVTAEPQARAWLNAERPNLVAAAVHTAGNGWPGHATRLAATLFRYLDTEGLWPEAVTIHGNAQQAARQIGDRAAEATALISLGIIDLRQARYAEATGRLEQALELYRETGDQVGEARALANLGFIDFLQGRVSQGETRLTRSTTMFRELGDAAGEARGLTSLGFFHLRQGRGEEAVDLLQRAAALCQEAGERGGEARAIGTLGEAEMMAGRYPQATTYCQRALDLFREIGDRISEADALTSLGRVELRQGRHEAAARYLREALALGRETGDLSSQACALNGLGEWFLATGQPAQARAQHAGALDLATESGEKHEQAHSHDCLAQAFLAGGDLTQARQHWQQAVELYDGLGAPEADQIRARLAAAEHTAACR